MIKQRKDKNKAGDVYAASVWLGTMFNYEKIDNI